MDLAWVMGFSLVWVVKISIVKVVVGGLGGFGVGYGLFLGLGVRKAICVNNFYSTLVCLPPDAASADHGRFLLLALLPGGTEKNLQVLFLYRDKPQITVPRDDAPLIVNIVQ